MTIKDYALQIRNKIDPTVLIKFDKNKKMDGVKRKNSIFLLLKKMVGCQK